MSNLWRSIAILFIGMIISGSAYAQPKVNSPYSRFGLGDVLDQRFAVIQTTGFTNAFHDYYHVNLHNPASLGHLTATAFEVGLYLQRSNWETSTDANTSWSGNLSYLSLGFPLNNPINQVLDREVKAFNWGMAFNLQPYTIVGYDIQTIGEIEDIGATTNTFRGTGGTYRFEWGNGFKYKQFSGGFKVGYLFGNITNERNTSFDDLEASFENRLNDNFNVSGFMWRLGAMYDLVLDEEDPRFKKSLTIGITYNSNQSINTNTSQFYERFNPRYVSPQDTLLNTTGLEGEGTLPAAFGVGVIYGVSNKWKIGVNYDAESWSNYRNDAKPETLSDSWRFSIGGEYIPDYSSYNSFGKKIRYRIGGFIGTDPRSIDGEQIEQRGITFGMGLPITLPRQQVSFVNLGFEFGQNGGNTTLTETYGRVTLGFTLNDNSWFYKRKFN